MFEGAFSWGGVEMSPWMAAGAMALSSISVVLLSLLLKLWRKPSERELRAQLGTRYADATAPANSSSKSDHSAAVKPSSVRTSRAGMRGATSLQSVHSHCAPTGAANADGVASLNGAVVLEIGPPPRTCYMNSTLSVHTGGELSIDGALKGQKPREEVTDTIVRFEAGRAQTLTASDQLTRDGPQML